MNVFAKFDEIPSMTLQDIKETKCQNVTDTLLLVRTDSTPSHKHSLRGGGGGGGGGGVVSSDGQYTLPQTQFAGGGGV